MLKEYFDGQFEVKASPRDISALKHQLGLLNPEAKDVLTISRFAIDDAFVGNDYLLTENDTVFIIPPSSGG